MSSAPYAPYAPFLYIIIRKIRDAYIGLKGVYTRARENGATGKSGVFMQTNRRQQIGSLIASGRMMIPEQNRKKFDREAQDVLNAVSAALDRGEEQKCAYLLAKWKKRTALLAALPDCHRAPPQLVPMPGESRIDYLNRCYEEGDF